MSRRKKHNRSPGAQHSGTRNQYAVRAHFRHAGAMHDRRQTRGGARALQQKWLDEYLDDEELEDDEIEVEELDENKVNGDSDEEKSPSKDDQD